MVKNRSDVVPSEHKILVVEDELTIREVIVSGLRGANYRVVEADDGVKGLALVSDVRPSLVVLDINMPEMGGFTVLETMRRRGFEQPVLLVSSQGAVDRRLKGLCLGADDFISKPFDLRELIARVAVLLRRHLGTQPAVTRLEHDGLVIDLAAKRAERNGVPLPLTATEFALLDVLARNAGRPVSREQLLDAVWGYSLLPNTRTVETHVWRLRKKLGDAAGRNAWIQNRSGLGYMIAQTRDGALPTHGRHDVAADVEQAVY